MRAYFNIKANSSKFFTSRITRRTSCNYLRAHCRDEGVFLIQGGRHRNRADSITVHVSAVFITFLDVVF